MNATGDSHARGVRSERERQIPEDMIYMWNLECVTGDPVCKTEAHHGRGERACHCQQGRGEEVGLMGSLRLVDANYYIQNG